MDAFTLSLLALIIVLALCIFFCISIGPEEPSLYPKLISSPALKATAKPAPGQRVPPVVDVCGPSVDVIRQEARRIRRTHPVLAQNVAVARLMRLDPEPR